MPGLLQDWSGTQLVTAAAAAGAAATVAYAAFSSARGGGGDPESGVRWRRVGKVDRLCMFPLKGGAAVR